ncbi:26s proteasome non-atpase regulatory subunit 7 [Anaeramoeba ignava]|uniref:26s proteasome non-atpase regulatory subunit 7 n=1 Tax=Anaeramoeba ignava TaxID=1746090 RepID=A0A9Q0R813_ANAIG|nr:26s proteasome non-atpase regulatory subunit 7 [Anaeramoeba ignava]
MSYTTVVVHPLVLLSVVDHYHRIAKDTRRRVIGCLLGELTTKHTLHVTNSFAVPFEEDDKNPKIWFVDHSYLETMFAMFKKVNAREYVVGWYSSGPKLRPTDLQIHEMFRKYAQDPVFVVINVHMNEKELGIPTQAYRSIEEIKGDGKISHITFQHIPSEITAFEAEEVGVEHLLRDITDTKSTSLITTISEKINSLKGLEKRINEIMNYLDKVLEKEIPDNQEILGKIQDIFNIALNLDVQNLFQPIAILNNDQTLIMYLSSMVRAVLALHDLINNKIANKRLEFDLQTKIEEAEERKKNQLEKLKENQKEVQSNQK